MDRLKLILEKYSRWQPLSESVERIEGYRHSDFSICVESSKSLLETIAKEICSQKKQPLTGSESFGSVLSLSFGSLGYPKTATIRQIGTSIANVATQLGNFRNEIGKISHGRTLDEIRNREETVESLTGDFLLDSTESVCCFLIETFEADNPLALSEPEITYDDNQVFNEFWDERYGTFAMGDYAFLASSILFNVDPVAYEAELSEFYTWEQELEQNEGSSDNDNDEANN